MIVSGAVIVDTNIVFSALLRSETRFSHVLFGTGHTFYVVELVLVELFKRKEKLVKASRLSEDEIVRFYHILLRRLNVYKEELITPAHRATAYALCQHVDVSDTPHVALTLELNGLLWTGDKTLKEALKRKGFTRFFDPTA